MDVACTTPTNHCNQLVDFCRYILWIPGMLVTPGMVVSIGMVVTFGLVVTLLEWLLHSRNEHWLNLLSALYNALEPMPCTPWSPKSGPKTKKCKNSKAVISDIFKIDYLETCNPNCAKGTTVPFSFATREAHNRPGRLSICSYFENLRRTGLSCS